MDELYNYVLTNLKTNDFAAGAVIAGVLTSTLMYLKNIPMTLYNRVKRLVIYEMILDETEDSFYEYFNKWLYLNYNKKFRNIKVKEIHVRDDDFNLIDISYYFEQYQDSFLFWYKGWPVYLHKIVEKLDNASNRSNSEIV